jgi:hypothetical protein
VGTSSRKPSQNTSGFWIYKENPRQVPKRGNNPRGDPGKWQLFISRPNVDAVWATVTNLVQEGKLGPAAKVSTMKPNPNTPPGGTDLHVIIVYAADWRDVSDVRRILKSLRDSGLARDWIHFKRDKETESGVYVVHGYQGVSVWNAPPGTGDEITTKWCTGKPILVTDENAASIVAFIEQNDQNAVRRESADGTCTHMDNDEGGTLDLSRELDAGLAVIVPRDDLDCLDGIPLTDLYWAKDPTTIKGNHIQMPLATFIKAHNNPTVIDQESNLEEALRDCNVPTRFIVNSAWIDSEVILDYFKIAILFTLIPR